MERGRLTIAPFHCVKCKNATACKAETRAMKQAARSGKPAGYTWRLWHDPAAGTPRPFRMPPPIWKAREAAWKRETYQAETRDEERRRMALQAAYFTERGWTWTGTVWWRDDEDEPTPGSDGDEVTAGD